MFHHPCHLWSIRLQLPWPQTGPPVRALESGAGPLCPGQGRPGEPAGRQSGAGACGVVSEAQILMGTAMDGMGCCMYSISRPMGAHYPHERLRGGRARKAADVLLAGA